MDKNQLKEKIEHIRSLMDPERAKKQRRVERGRGMARGLAVGTLLGSLAGVLFAPDKGENTRKKTKEELEKAKEVLENNFQEGKVKLSNFMEDKKDILNDKMYILKEKMISDGILMDDDYLDQEEELEKEEA